MKTDIVSSPQDNSPAPVTPPAETPPAATPETPSFQPVAPEVKPDSHTDVLGIISIIMAFMGLSLVGFILGLIGAKKAKKEGHSPTLSTVGWVINLVFMLLIVPLFIGLVLNNFQGAQAKARDTERVNDINNIHSQLETYFAGNFGYPSTLSDLEITDTQILLGPVGSSIKINEVVANAEEANASVNPTPSQEYTYTPYGKPNCTNNCDGYVLKTYIERPASTLTNPYVKLGLENL